MMVAVVAQRWRRRRKRTEKSSSFIEWIITLFTKLFPKYLEFCSVNTNKYHTSDLEDNLQQQQQQWVANGTGGGGGVDEGVIGWSGNDSIIIIWKLKKFGKNMLLLKQKIINMI